MGSMFQDERASQAERPAGSARVRVGGAGGPPDRGQTACRIQVKVVPGSRRDEVVGALGDRLKVKVSAAPEDGKANAAVCALIAARLGVHARVVSIVSGHGNPEKVVRVEGVSAAGAEASLLG